MTSIRGTIESASGGKIPIVTVYGKYTRISDIPLLQSYGFASRPPVGAEGLVIRDGDNRYCIASGDRRYRLELGDGEVALYDNSGNSILLKNTGQIIVNADVINLGGENLSSLAGVVTGQCACAFTGAPHPVVSSKVRAAL